ncbi:hypothetical protein H9636_12695 [Ureibacillus sp. Re31]|uniref:Uncharacterized protein n=1 Tax=Ureibacillus galli TaxID=2762222 RepID=A0ABR8XE39_9BACL|nr:hypothetical protein [Ureibacillus galli]
MKIFHSIIGILIIFLSSFFMSITVGFVILFGGILYLKKIAQFGKQ